MGGTPNCFFTLVAKANHFRQMLVELHLVAGSNPAPDITSQGSSVGRAEIVSPIPCCRTRNHLWRMLVGTTLWMSRSWVRIPLLLPWRDSSAVERVMFHPFLVARDQNSGISSGWLECRTWTAEVGGSNPPSLTKRNETGGMPVGLHRLKARSSRAEPDALSGGKVSQSLVLHQRFIRLYLSGRAPGC